MLKKNILVFGANGLVGSSCMRILSTSSKVSTVIPSTRKDTNLFSLEETKQKIISSKPDVVIIAAAKVGGFLQIIPTELNFLLKT